MMALVKKQGADSPLFFSHPAYDQLNSANFIMCLFQLFEVVSHLAAIIGIGIAAYQLWLTRQQAETTFEDSIAKEYRDLAYGLPTKIFYDYPHSQALTDDEKCKAQEEFYRYFDLTNGQIFLREVGRISQQTWQFWCDGIKTNMQRTAFKAAWDDIGSKAQLDFAELRLLIECNYEIDPNSPDWRYKIAIKRDEFNARRKKLNKEQSEVKDTITLASANK